MTNERAVEILNLDLDILGQYGDETAEAYKMAIKALEQKKRVETALEAVEETRKWMKTAWGIDAPLEPIITAIKALEQQPCEDCISREEMLKYQQYLHGKMSNEENHKLWNFIKGLPSVTPKYTDEEIDKAQAVEQAYVDKMVELAVEESRKKWLNSFDTSSATKCYEAVNVLKERLEHEET